MYRNRALPVHAGVAALHVSFALIDVAISSRHGQTIFLFIVVRHARIHLATFVIKDVKYWHDYNAEYCFRLTHLGPHGDLVIFCIVDVRHERVEQVAYLFSSSIYNC
jgi:hypothetical protein